MVSMSTSSSKILRPFDVNYSLLSVSTSEVSQWASKWAKGHICWKGPALQIIKPENATSTQNTVPSKGALRFKVCSKMFIAHHFPWEVITTKGPVDSKDHHCESKDSKKTSSKLKFSRQASILKMQLQKCIKAEPNVTFSKSQILGTKHCFLWNPQLEPRPMYAKPQKTAHTSTRVSASIFLWPN